MVDTETHDHEVTVRLLKDGSLPKTIACPFCGGGMKRLLWRRKPTYRCEGCDCDTILDYKENK